MGVHPYEVFKLVVWGDRKSLIRIRQMMEGLLRLRSAKSRTTHPILDQKSSFSSRYSSHLKTPDFEHSSSKKESLKLWRALAVARSSGMRWVFEGLRGVSGGLLVEQTVSS